MTSTFHHGDTEITEKKQIPVFFLRVLRVSVLIRIFR